MSLDHLSFESPQYFFVLLLIPSLAALAIVMRRRRLRYTVAFTNLDLLGDVAEGHRIRWRRQLPLFILAVALFASAAALAGPRIQLHGSSRQGATVVLLVDVSGSMQASDVYPTRLRAAADLMRELVQRLPASTKVGLVTLSDNVEIINPPTTNHAAIDNELVNLKPEGGTAIGEGVETAVRLIVSTLATVGVHHTDGTYLPAAVVLASDGGQDRGSISSQTAAEFAQETGVRIYGVVLGTYHGYIYQRTQGGPALRVRIPVPPDYGSIAQFARASGGAAFQATTAASLQGIDRKLGSAIERDDGPTEITSWFEAGAAVLLLASFALALGLGAALP